MNVEQAVIQALAANGRNAYADAPNPMPSEFVTVERTGGGDRNQVDAATLAVQCWADRRKRAADMADDVRSELKELTGTGGFGAVTVQSIYNWPDPQSRKARYQLTVSVVAHV
ncbi:MAG: hypothetical protein IJ087_10085 [Eggerthellaceae bacterium]|nr:hypothetical protein [Eggerthellaceae bacterium]